MLDVATATRTSTEHAVRELLLAGIPRAHRLATWILHDSVAAEDAVQEAALLAWDRRGSLREADSVEAWFNRILVNVCRAELRRRARWAPITEMEPASASAPESLGRRDELSRAILTLTADGQVLLALRFGHDLTVPLIAVTTGMREGTVKSRLHSALHHLRAALDAGRRVEESLR
jgi:RNA polymerase sigma-70 factor (ECF subfamily)